MNRFVSSSAREEEELKRLSEELSEILQYDKIILLCYAYLLKQDGEVNERTIFEMLGKEIDNIPEILQRMMRDGLVIRGNAGYLPLHPRLAISNLYRLALARDEKVRQHRVRVDAITARLVKFREEVQKW